MYSREKEKKVTRARQAVFVTSTDPTRTLAESPSTRACVCVWNMPFPAKKLQINKVLTCCVTECEDDVGNRELLPVCVCVSA